MVGVGDIDMTHVLRQDREPGLHFFAVSIPLDQAMNSECVTQIMNSDESLFCADSDRLHQVQNSGSDSVLEVSATAR